jgi:hypothetical protein
LRSPGHARTAIRSPADRHESWRSDHRSMRETAPNGQAPSGGGPRAPSRKYSPRPRPSRAGALCCGAGTRLPRSALSDRRGVGPPSYLHPLQSGGADPSPLPHAALTGSPAVADPARTHGSRSGQPAPSWQPTAGVSASRPPPQGSASRLGAQGRQRTLRGDFPGGAFGLLERGSPSKLLPQNQGHFDVPRCAPWEGSSRCSVSEFSIKSLFLLVSPAGVEPATY